MSTTSEMEDQLFFFFFLKKKFFAITLHKKVTSELQTILKI